MGLFGRRPKDDESLIEVSNDNGDHVVIHVPTKEAKGVERALREAGCVRDNDFERRHEYKIEQKIKDRDPDQHRYRSARTVDEYEDFEDNHDQEMEASDYEYSEQPASPWWNIFG